MRSLIIISILAVASAKPFISKAARNYAELHPNTDYDNPEYLNPNGDILTPEGESKMAEIGQYNAITNRNRRWTGGILYYQLDDDFTADEELRIEAAVADLNLQTSILGFPCIQIQRRTNEENYVSIQKYSGCSSYLGMLGGAQRMSLVSGCFSHGTIMHEFLHALGFHHEQKRSDSEDYIIVNYDNIREGTEYNFTPLTSSQIDLLGTPYDYSSVMHYGAYAFAIDRSIPTIIPLDPTAEIAGSVRKCSPRMVMRE